MPRQFMRFLMLNWRDPLNPKSGGAERVTQGYLSALAERGHEVYWFAFAFPGCKAQEKVGNLTILRGGNTGSAILSARRWYREQPRFDLVIDQHHGIPWFSPWWCGTHCVAYIHEVLGPIWGSFYGWPISQLGPLQERWTHWLYRNVPFWTACGGTRDQLKKHGVKSVTQIPYGVHTIALPSLEDKNISQPLRLAVVSRLAPNKRIDHAIRVVSCLQSRGIKSTMDVIGGGEDEPRLRQLVADLNIGSVINFCGKLSESDKDERLRQCHLLLHTSIREGWGLNVIEANAMGTPTVVYPVEGLVESTLHQKTGLVSALETPESLAECIVQLCKQPDDYKRYRVQAWERSKTFHWSRVLPPACDWLEAQASGNKRFAVASFELR